MSSTAYVTPLSLAAIPIPLILTTWMDAFMVLSELLSHLHHTVLTFWFRQWMHSLSVDYLFGSVQQISLFPDIACAMLPSNTTYIAELGRAFASNDTSKQYRERASGSYVIWLQPVPVPPWHCCRNTAVNHCRRQAVKPLVMLHLPDNRLHGINYCSERTFGSCIADRLPGWLRPDLVVPISHSPVERCIFVSQSRNPPPEVGRLLVGKIILDQRTGNVEEKQGVYH